MILFKTFVLKIYGIPTKNKSESKMYITFFIFNVDFDKT